MTLQTTQLRSVEFKPAADPARSSLDAGAATVHWILAFIAFEIVCQLLLLFPQTAVWRVPLRVASFGVSLALLFVLPRRNCVRLHPAFMLLALSLVLLMVGVVHPQTNGLIAAIATVVQTAAIMAPVLWVGGLRLDTKDFHRIIQLIWLFAAASSFVGVMQTLHPEWTFLQPNLSAVVQGFNDGGEGLKISLANGAQVFRPMGLSDQPGGAAMSGMMVIVFGMGLLVQSKHPGMWMLLLAGMVLGLVCIYLSQVRSVLLMTAICVIALCIAVSRRGDFFKLSGALTALLLVVLIATTWAITVGGDSVTGRLATLIEENPGAVYYQNRGRFLEYTIKYVIPTYPFGAGLGRWGMINYYFGNPSGSESLWAEIMWTAWAYDGGVPLILSSAAAVGVAIWQAWRLSGGSADLPSNAGEGSTERSADLRLWGAVLFAYNIGALAVTFNYPFFMSQSGMDFWLLNAALFTAAQYEHANRAARRRPVSPIEAPVTSTPRPASLLGMQS